MIRKNPPIKRKKENQLQKVIMEKPSMIIRELCKRDFYYFFHTFWEELGGGENLVDNWHIQYLCNEAQEVVERIARGEKKKHDLLINIPPGTTKTTILLKALPVWCWINWYWMRIITASYSDRLALEAAECSREIIRGEKFQYLFPDIGIKADKEQKSNYKVVKKVVHNNGFQRRELIGGERFTTSVGGTVAGIHCHLFLIDDPLNPHQAPSKAFVREANRWCDETPSTRKVDKDITAMIMVMQRLTQNDPSGHLLAKGKKNIKHICLPGTLDEGYEELVNPPELKQHYKNRLLDPIRLSPSILAELKMDLGQYGYAGQIGQKPTPPGGGMFRVDNMMTMDYMPKEHEIIQVVRYWDKAGTQDSGAYTVGVKMAKLDTGKFLIVDIQRGQWSTDNREKMIKRTAEADGRNCTVYIEQEPGSGGKESAESTIRNLAGYVCIKDRPQGDKVYRADPFSVQVNEGNVMMMRAGWNKALIDELEFFPLSEYKDQVDGCSGAFSKLTGKKKAKTL